MDQADQYRVVWIDFNARRHTRPARSSTSSVSDRLGVLLGGRRVADCAAQLFRFVEMAPGLSLQLIRDMREHFRLLPTLFRLCDFLFRRQFVDACHDEPPVQEYQKACQNGRVSVEDPYSFRYEELTDLSLAGTLEKLPNPVD